MFIEVHPVDRPLIVNTDEITTVEAPGRGSGCVISIRGWGNTLQVMEEYGEIRALLDAQSVHTPVEVPS